uniref:WD_REPEATS_REGION domain-containing protein n=1 Tax=Steinernema glaseri TaxID=37863 RepID=A0A1I7Y7S2_9BILA
MPSHMKTEVVNLVATDLTPADGKFKKLKRDRKERAKYYMKKFGSSKHNDPFPDKVPVNEDALKRHDTGAKDIDISTIKTGVHKKRMEKKKERFLSRIEKTARAELLNKEEDGFLEAEEGHATYSVRQRDIADAVDIASATKHFELDLPKFGPYRVDYTRNGRHLLIGGKRGHVAALDWMTKKLHTETNVMESVRDVQWLHVETMYAVAQKRWTFIYDKQGVELHCLKQLHDIKRLEFLPRHFLLVAGSNTSFLHYMDVSTGNMVKSFKTYEGPVDVMAQNPYNAMIFTGNSRGVVSMWSPNANKPLVQMLTHKSPVQGIAVHQSGNYMTTTGLDGFLRVWDLRKQAQLHAYRLPRPASHVAMSQKGVVACSLGSLVHIYKDASDGTLKEPYLLYNAKGLVSDLRFCPYEDVLGVGHTEGFTSMLVPGSGDPNFDAAFDNPYESVTQRKEREIRQLLDKIQPEMISLDPSDINRVNIPALEDKIEMRQKVLYQKPEEVKVTVRHRMRGRSGASAKQQRLQGVKADRKKEHIKQKREAEKEFLGLHGAGEGEAPAQKSVLERFKNKTK